MRVASLAPSATETLHAMGAPDVIAACTDHCPGDHPSVGGWLAPDIDHVVDIDPDLAVTADPLQADIRDDLRDAGVAVLHLEPRTLDETVASVAELGDAVDRSRAADRLETEMRRRIDRVDAETPTDRPVVYCEEWPTPPMAAGNWVPDAIEAAGARYPYVDPGERSRKIEYEAVVRHDPEHVILHYCGAGADANPSTFRERWDLDATVHVLHDDLLNQPSPRLVEGVERVASILHDYDPPEEPVAVQ